MLIRIVRGVVVAKEVEILAGGVSVLVMSGFFWFLFWMAG
jgi:hypothetical protein